MFDIGWGELFLIGVVALIVVGPKELPGLFRTVGNFTGKARGMAREFQRSLEQAANECRHERDAAEPGSIDQSLERRHQLGAASSPRRSAARRGRLRERRAVRAAAPATRRPPAPLPRVPSRAAADAGVGDARRRRPERRDGPRHERTTRSTTRRRR